MLPNRSERPLPDDWALAAPDSSRTAATMAAAVTRINGSIRRFMSHPLPSNSPLSGGPVTVSNSLTLRPLSLDSYPLLEAGEGGNRQSARPALFLDAKQLPRCDQSHF